MLLDKHPVLALVPARSGSKAVVKKNMRVIRGMPLVGYTLSAALKSEYITSVYLSTDDDDAIAYIEETKVIAIRRPEEFCKDTSTANDVVKHFLSTLSDNIISSDPYIIYLQPTSPLRTEHHIDSAFTELTKQAMHKLISVTIADVSIYKSFVLNEEGLLEALYNDKKTNQPRQSLPEVYLPNGAIYVFRVSDFLTNGQFPSSGSYPFVMSELDSIDIDSENDIKLLSYILSSNISS